MDSAPLPLAWSPDGKSLIVADRSSDFEPWALFLLSIETGEKRRLTSSVRRKGLGMVSLPFRRMVALGVYASI